MKKVQLVGCGILKKEVNYLIKKNSWSVETNFLDSSLHINFDKLSSGLMKGLQRQEENETVVFYGCCHPLMDQMVEQYKTVRTRGQNCVDILLGDELFQKELDKGAFFLFEDWARRWEYLMKKSFCSNLELASEIFKLDRKYLLCINTPCSNDFTKYAEQSGKLIGVPVRWIDVNLDHLELVLEQVLITKQGYMNAQEII